MWSQATVVNNRPKNRQYSERLNQTRTNPIVNYSVSMRSKLDTPQISSSVSDLLLHISLLEHYSRLRRHFFSCRGSNRAAVLRHPGGPYHDESAFFSLASRRCFPFLLFDFSHRRTDFSIFLAAGSPPAARQTISGQRRRPPRAGRAAPAVGGTWGDETGRWRSP
jgi:hypothetical protein